jgi:hypothetical protein
VYGVCAAVVLAALGWITATVLGLERAEIRARTDAGHQESLRLALWRMDSWLASLLAREAARPYFDYEAFYPQQRAYSTLLYPIEHVAPGSGRQVSQDRREGLPEPRPDQVERGRSR